MDRYLKYFLYGFIISMDIMMCCHTIYFVFYTYRVCHLKLADCRGRCYGGHSSGSYLKLDYVEQ